VTNRLGERMGYAYDAGGNFQYRTNNALVQTFAVDNVNQLTGVSRSGTLTVVGGTTATAASVTVKDVTPHTLRHTLAMTLLQSGVDIAVIGPRALAGARVHRNHANLSACRHGDEGSSTGSNGSGQDPTPSIPSKRQASRVAGGGTLIPKSI